MSDDIDHLTRELEPLLAPVSAALPCGEALRGSWEMQALRIARGEDPAPQRSHRQRPAEPPWREIAAAAQRLLVERSKDLRVACWLAEAWTHLDQLDGLMRGLLLISLLSARFRDRLHPHAPGADELDLDEAVARLNALDLVLPQALQAPAAHEVGEELVVAQEIAKVKQASQLLHRFESALPSLSTSALRRRLEALSEELASREENARWRREWLQQEQARVQREANMSQRKRLALRERARVMRDLHAALLFLEREQPDGVANLLIERALRLFRATPDDLVAEWDALSRWSADDRLPGPTVFDEPAAGFVP